MAKNYLFEDIDASSSKHLLFISHYINNLIKDNIINKQQIIFEIGCGRGILLDKFHKMGFKTTGVEPSKTGFELLNKYYPYLEVKNIDGYSPLIRTDDEHFFLLLEVLEHCFSPKEIIQNIHRTMKPGEKLLISLPYHGYFKNLVIALLGLYDKHHDVSWECGHIKFFSKNTISKLLKENKFKIISIKTYGRIPIIANGMFILVEKI